MNDSRKQTSELRQYFTYADLHYAKCNIRKKKKST